MKETASQIWRRVAGLTDDDPEQETDVSNAPTVSQQSPVPRVSKRKQRKYIKRKRKK